MQHSSSTNPTCTKASWKPRGNHHAIPTSQLTPMQKKVSRSTIAAARLHPQFGLKLPPLLLKSGLLHTHTHQRSYSYVPNKQACLLNYFTTFFHPACPYWILLSLFTVASGNSVSHNSGISCYSGFAQMTNCLFYYAFLLK